MSGSDSKKGRRRSLRNLTRLVSDVLPAALTERSGDDTTNRVPILRLNELDENITRIENASLETLPPAERSAAARRLEEEIHRRLTRWLHLESAMRSTQQEVVRLQAANEDANTTIEALKVAEQEYLASIATLKATDEERLSTIETLQSKLNEAASEMGAHRDALIGLQHALDEANRSTHRHEAEKAELAASLDDVRKETATLGGLRTEIQSLKQTIKDLESRAATQNKLIAVLSEGIDDVGEVAATISNVDAWVRHHATASANGNGNGNGRFKAPERIPQPRVPGQPVQRSIEALDGAYDLKFRLQKPVVTIGRSADSDIRVGGPYTSRHHARIVNDAEDVVIEDLGSANGVLVNDALVERCPLHDGDILDIGGSRFVFIERGVANFGAPASA